MKRGYARRLLRLTQVGVLTLISGVALADDPTGYIRVGGIDLYYAVLPAETIRGYPKGSPEFTMHGGPPARKHQHHVMVALFESKSGERIADAEVKANVGEAGLAGQTKELEPMTIAGALTYGNFFELRYRVRYLISIQIRMPGSPPAIETRFEYDHH